MTAKTPTVISDSVDSVSQLSAVTFTAVNLSHLSKSYVIADTKADSATKRYNNVKFTSHDNTTDRQDRTQLYTTSPQYSAKLCSNEKGSSFLTHSV